MLCLHGDCPKGSPSLSGLVSQLLELSLGLRGVWSPAPEQTAVSSSAQEEEDLALARALAASEEEYQRRQQEQVS